MLHSLGITLDVFRRKQAAYFTFLEASRTDPRVAFRLLGSLGMAREAEDILIQGFDKVRKDVQKAISREYSKMLKKGDEQKIRILIPKSRLIFGICDHYGVLNPGECFLRVTLEESGAPLTITGVDVLVSRNPCLHPGDLRKLKAVDRQELRHLTDCIVFSTRGKRPSADLMSGGDLDGDTCNPTLPSTLELPWLLTCHSLCLLGPRIASSSSLRTCRLSRGERACPIETHHRR